MSFRSETIEVKSYYISYFCRNFKFSSIRSKIRSLFIEIGNINLVEIERRFISHKKSSRKKFERLLKLKQQTA